MNLAKYNIATTRFNSQTLEENLEWRHNNEFNGCIYNTPIKLSPKTPKHSILFILEMNNDTNKITGIGIIKNQLDYDYCRVYSNNNYNRFTYKSNYYIPSIDLVTHLDIIQQIEKYLFTGKSHLKRGQGITTFPPKFQNTVEIIDLLQNHQFENLIAFLRHIFLERYTQIRI
jgi:hypothetical protein